MRPAEEIKRLVKNTKIKTSPSANEHIFKTLADELISTKTHPPAEIKPGTWRFIMKSKITKLTAAAVITIAVITAVHFLGGSLDGTSVAWAQVVQEVEQSHNQYYADLLKAVDAEDAELVADRADALSEFWQAIGYLAEAKRGQTTLFHPEDSVKVVREITLAGMLNQNEQQIFSNHARKFVDWINAIEDSAWIDETVHVCKQLEEYAEEIREVGRHPEVRFEHVAHCMHSFTAYCQWFENLPWDDPKEVASAPVLLAAIRRDLEIARREIDALEIRDADRYAKRCMEQAHNNIAVLRGRIDAGSPRLQQLPTQLAKKVDKLSQLIAYAQTGSWYIQQTAGVSPVDAFAGALQKQFGSKESIRDYFIREIIESLDLCSQLSDGLGTAQ